MSFPFRVKLKTWYGILLASWLTLMLPASCFIAQATNASGRYSIPEIYADMVVGSFSLLSQPPLGPFLFAWVWLPVLAAPFGLFEKIDQE
jgi:hypothetical protein